MLDWGTKQMSSAKLPPPTKIQTITKWLMTKGGSSLGWLKKNKTDAIKKNFGLPGHIDRLDCIHYRDIHRHP
jgi:hypothetical protein